MDFQPQRRAVVAYIHTKLYYTYQIGTLPQVKIVEVTYIQACVEQNVSESLSFAQNGINQDDNRVIFYVLVHWLLAGLLEKRPTDNENPYTCLLFMC